MVDNEMAQLDGKLTPAPLLPTTNNNSTSPTTTQYQPLIDQTLSLLKPLGIFFLVVILVTIYAFARYTEAQLIINFFGWNRHDSEVGVLCLYGVPAAFGSLITAGVYLDGPGKSLLGGSYGKYYWHVWTAIAMVFPMALVLVFLGCAWLVITVWQGLSWLVGLVGIGGSGEGVLDATTGMNKSMTKN